MGDKYSKEATAGTLDSSAEATSDDLPEPAVTRVVFPSSSSTHHSASSSDGSPTSSSPSSSSSGCHNSSSSSSSYSSGTETERQRLVREICQTLETPSTVSKPIEPKQQLLENNNSNDAINKDRKNEDPLPSTPSPPPSSSSSPKGMVVVMHHLHPVRPSLSSLLSPMSTSMSSCAAEYVNLRLSLRVKQLSEHICYLYRYVCPDTAKNPCGVRVVFSPHKLHPRFLQANAHDIHRRLYPNGGGIGSLSPYECADWIIDEEIMGWNELSPNSMRRKIWETVTLNTAATAAAGAAASTMMVDDRHSSRCREGEEASIILCMEGMAMMMLSDLSSRDCTQEEGSAAVSKQLAGLVISIFNSNPVVSHIFMCTPSHESFIENTTWKKKHEDGRKCKDNASMLNLPRFNAAVENESLFYMHASCTLDAVPPSGTATIPEMMEESSSSPGSQQPSPLLSLPLSPRSMALRRSSEKRHKEYYEMQWQKPQHHIISHIWRPPALYPQECFGAFRVLGQNGSGGGGGFRKEMDAFNNND